MSKTHNQFQAVSETPASRTTDDDQDQRDQARGDRRGVSAGLGTAGEDGGSQ